MTSTRTATLNRWIAITVIAGLVILSLLVPEVLRMVLIAVLLAYILDPIVTAIELRGLSRTVSTIVFFGFVACILWVVFAFLAPVIVEQIQTLQQGANDVRTAEVILRLQMFIRAKLGFLGLGDFDLAKSIRVFGENLRNRILDFVVNEGLSVVIHCVTIPFMVFFFLKEGRDMKKALISLVPNRYFEFSLDLLYKMDMQLGNYLRSQFTDAIAFGVLTTIALWIIDVKYFIFIGAFAGLANLIPYVGPIAGALPAVAVSLFDTGDAGKAVTVVVTFIALKLIDDVIIQPMLVAKGVNLHPLLVLVAIIAGGELFGMLGMLLAVPATGFIKVVLQESMVTLRKYRFAD
jgi:putative permease